MNTITLTDEEVASLTQSILTRYGIDFTCYEPQSLKRRISRVLSMHNFGSIHELWIHILSERSFIQSFMDCVSVGMTSMFRDPIFWKSLRGVLTDISNRSSLVSIWHAGCSTGEEVFSAGILLKELALLEKAKSLATDINVEAIETAKKGEYHKIRMIENERNYKEYNPFSPFSRYHTKDTGNILQMDLSLCQHVTFRQHNLITDPIIGTYDLILCRNVMIYFDSKAKEILLQKFYAALNPDGYLAIGFYDTMLSLIDQDLFVPVDKDARIFRKVGKG